MPFAISNIKTSVTAVGNVKLAVAQPTTTQRASLYGVEVSCQSGFSADPELDIYVFNNPLAAKDFIESYGQTLAEDQGSLKLGAYAYYDETTPGRYVITAQRAEFPAVPLKLAPLGIPGCAYMHDPNPFYTDTEKDVYPRVDSGFLTIVAVFNAAANLPDDYVFIRTRMIHG